MGDPDLGLPDGLMKAEAGSLGVKRGGPVIWLEGRPNTHPPKLAEKHKSTESGRGSTDSFPGVSMDNLRTQVRLRFAWQPEFGMGAERLRGIAPELAEFSSGLRSPSPLRHLPLGSFMIDGSRCESGSQSFEPNGTSKSSVACYSLNPTSSGKDGYTKRPDSCKKGQVGTSGNGKLQRERATPSRQRDRTALHF